MDIPSMGIMAAFAAGTLSFLSPCVLPLIPSYVTFITGMTLDELTGAVDEQENVRKSVLLHGLLFVGGFTFIFVLAGASVGFLSGMVIVYSQWIERAGGALLIALGLYLLGFLKLPGASRERRLHLSNKPLGYLGTLGVGVAFGAGWTPCLGPVISGILTLAANSGSAAAGAGLLFVYSTGLAIPFLLSALLLNRFLGGVKKIGPWLPWMGRLSGALLIVIGLLLLEGSFSVLVGYLNQVTPEFLLDRL